MDKDGLAASAGSERDPFGSAARNARLNAIEVRGGNGPGWKPGQPFPDLGDPKRSWPAILTEPEISAIHSAFGFIRAACKDWPSPLGKAYWAHYGPALEVLSQRLAASNLDRAPASTDPRPTDEPKQS